MPNTLPPIEHEPPFSIDFLAHLHGGCYLPDVTARLLEAVNRDPSAAKVLDALTAVQLELRMIRPGDPAR